MDNPIIFYLWICLFYIAWFNACYIVWIFDCNFIGFVVLVEMNRLQPIPHKHLAYY